MQQLMKEMLSAQHLLYVSLKYTKTCDVILNLIQRWQNMIEVAIGLMLQKAKKKKIISAIPANPRPCVELLEKIFKKEANVKEALALYTFFKKIPALEIVREHEFRKNVTLRIINNLTNEEVAIDLEKLKAWQALLEKFISFVRVYVQ